MLITKLIGKVVLLLMICFMAIQFVSNASEAEIFESDEFNFSFTIPDGWIVLDNGLVPGVKALVRSTSEGASANCNVRAALNSQFDSTTSEDYISMIYPDGDPGNFISEYEASGLNPELITSSIIKVDSTDALYIELYISSQSSKFQTFNIQFLKNGGLYTIGCTDMPETFDASKSDFDTVTGTFKTR